MIVGCVHRSVITDPSGQIVAEIAGPSSSSDASGSTAGSTVESLSGSEGMAPIQTVCTSFFHLTVSPSRVVLAGSQVHCTWHCRSVFSTNKLQ